MMKLARIFRTVAVILTSLAVVAFFAFPILVQVFYTEGFVHIEAMFGSSFDYFINSFLRIADLDVMVIASLSSLALILIIILAWIVVSSIRKLKTAGCIIWGTLVMLITYFYALIFFFDDGDIIYKGAVEFSKGGEMFFILLLNGALDEMFRYGMLGTGAALALAFLLVIASFFLSIFSKPQKKEDPVIEKTEEVKPISNQHNQLSEDKIRNIIREELSRSDKADTETNVDVATVAIANSQEPKEEPIASLDPEKAETPLKDGEYNTLDPIEKIFADIESNRPELDNPLPKKGETPLTNEKKEEPKVEEMSIEEKMEAGIKTQPVETPKEEIEDEDEIERLEDNHLD